MDNYPWIRCTEKLPVCRVDKDGRVCSDRVIILVEDTAGRTWVSTGIYDPIENGFIEHDYYDGINFVGVSSKEVGYHCVAWLPLPYFSDYNKWCGPYRP